MSAQFLVRAPGTGIPGFSIDLLPLQRQAGDTHAREYLLRHLERFERLMKHRQDCRIVTRAEAALAALAAEGIFIPEEMARIAYLERLEGREVFDRAEGELYSQIVRSLDKELRPEIERLTERLDRLILALMAEEEALWPQVCELHSKVRCAAGRGHLRSALSAGRDRAKEELKKFSLFNLRQPRASLSCWFPEDSPL